ncbi:tRNA U34 5-methylaminomethyl-2-thiouridine-forming methyltransferase MnmC [Ulvibacter sp. MAR_2010_11]|uniref:tRNA (5-methylaminomethyl-2-thiouridine)(34)-methyltransferase MnmD n=1 Tax=Ulvibacter sp. MAR_2010_11 TaxID=1250229 RepID=UPI000C2CC02D|nr:tRNA (5-methylaminomethyl-2-thiouridine)(34)-methyltransferase MnmD [Ulvibacter sp. MAR_2010_11]PKA82188.1 tRNA U34 5-methylaminomethyl-2-thiouridine-forming methyltransferase MnmC [Ulvibacter sp. MAR_2010_11]
MKREIRITGDGSVTIHLPEWNEQYHSIHGAIAEAQHVFIKNGLHFYAAQNPGQPVSILEIGFGTGLNAFLTLLEAEKLSLSINYTGTEAYPVAPSEIVQLNYAENLNASAHHFNKLHEVPWETTSEIIKQFNLTKQKLYFSEINVFKHYDLIYFDAFGARVQPELWTEAIFQKMFDALKENGVLVTYSAKGSVRRAMQAVGFTVERLPGPPGKREMLRALKRD